jgi:transcriptional regulator with GAF, ATPase, and Fis domain
MGTSQTVTGEATRILRSGSKAVAQLVRVYRLRVRRPDRETELREFAQTCVRVGTQRSNDVVVEDDAVSRIHFEIVAEDEGFVLRDLGSTNGTRVDDWRVREVFLRPGARIEVGNTEISFEPLDVEAELPLSEEERFGNILGRSPPMRELFAALKKVSGGDVTVLVEGETGTGKELIAESIHRAGHRAAGPFVVFDCAAVAANLVESELFGHEKGSFTGASRTRAGCLEEADGGTLFVDELGELPLELQPKLLRALERREVKRVGGNKVQKTDVRIVAATNRDLAREVNAGTFREDLYYRLAVVRIRLPPLRERIEDIPVLVVNFLRQLLVDPAYRTLDLQDLRPGLLEPLLRYPWPGNVRELRNVVERAVAMAGGDMPTEFSPTSVRYPMNSRPLPVAEPGAIASASASAPARTEYEPPVDLDRPMLEQKQELIASFEKRYVEGVLARNDGKISRAASAAAIDRMYFKRLMKKYAV